MSQARMQVEIQMKECLDARWMEWFAGFDLTAGRDGFTRLTGEIPDRAALHGILERIRDLNLSLISVQVTEIDRKG